MVAPNRCPILLVFNDPARGKLLSGSPTDLCSDQGYDRGGATSLNVHMPNSISYVGVFWMLQQHGRSVDLLAHRCPLSKAERYGDKLTCAHGHYEIWEKWRRLGVAGAVKSSIEFCEYEEWPRGRVVHDTVDRHFIVYADPQILHQPRLLARVFRLQAKQVEPKWDNHYRASRRLLLSAG